MEVDYGKKPLIKGFLVMKIAVIESAACGLLQFAMAGYCAAGIGAVDWESGELCSQTWLFSGLLVTNARGAICVQATPPVTNGTRSTNDLAGMSVSHVNGLTFTPISVDLGEYSTTVTDPTVHFIGHKPNGETVFASFDLDEIADGAGGADDFQNFLFPPEFVDIARLEVPNTFWRCDNLAFSTVIPPEFPADQQIGKGYLTATLRYSKPLLDDTLIIGPDYQFVSGFRPDSPTNVKFLAPEGTATLSSVYSPSYDRAEKALYFSQGNPGVIRKYQAGAVSDAVVLEELTAAGYPVASIYGPLAAGGRLFFNATGASGGEPTYLFLKKDGVMTAVVEPSTQLPVGSEGSPPAAVGGGAVNPNSIAFFATLISKPQVSRLYASFANGPIQEVIGETDPIPMGQTYLTVNQLGKCEFTKSGELKVKATLSNGDAWLFFASEGLTRIDPVAATVSPLNAGKQVTGTYYRADSGEGFIDTHEEIFREHEGSFFRLIGVGDQVFGETISYIEFKAVPDELPLRAVVEVRYESSKNTTARILELLLDSPVVQPPRFGAPVVHSESGDLFIPLYQLTYGREYWLQRSEDLTEWEDLWPIDDVVPIQHVVIPPSLLGSSSFYRVEQR